MIKLLASVRITVVCLFLLFILTFWGTIAQVEHGLYAAQQRYFSSFFFLAGGFIPCPGAQLILWVLFINLLAATIIYFSKYRQWTAIGLKIIHGGLLLYLASAFFIFHLAQESSMTLGEGQESRMARSNTDATKIIELPFTIKLDQFRAEFHPGTQVAKSYESDVTFSAGQVTRQVKIYMNNPLRFKDYTVYQASYSTDKAGRYYSTFAIVKNSARLLPYIACFVVFLGLTLHFLIQALASKAKK